MYKASQEIFNGIDLDDLIDSFDQEMLKDTTLKLINETYNLQALQIYDLVKNSFTITENKF